MYEDSAEAVRHAILSQAVKDYIQALRANDTRNIYALERFFKSAWGEYLSDYHGDYIISECKRRVKEGNT